MNHTTATTPTGHHATCPTRSISVELPLATIEELDHLAELTHTSRQHVLAQIIDTALLSNTPQLPPGHDAIDWLAERAHLTRRRSLELAARRTAA